MYFPRQESPKYRESPSEADTLALALLTVLSIGHRKMCWASVWPRMCVRVAMYRGFGAMLLIAQSCLGWRKDGKADETSEVVESPHVLHTHALGTRSMLTPLCCNLRAHSDPELGEAWSRSVVLTVPAL